MSLKHTEQQRLASYHLWGKGRIGEYIDRGGFGQVYELYGLHEDGTADALKVVTIEYTEEAEQRGEDKQKYLLNGLRSMLDEIHRMMEFKQLDNFVSIYGYEDYPIRENGELVGYDILIRMEKLTVLTKYIEERRAQDVPVTEQDILQVGVDVCTGLQEANLLVQKENHEVEFIHRDIKPENIFVAADGTYKLGDLGIATMNRHTQYSTVGTPSYMAPEMFLERGYHANVDLFALGRTLEKLTDGMVLQSGLQQVICKAEALQPEDRYQTAQEMLEDLNRCVYRLEHPEEFAESDAAADHPRPIRKWDKHTERMTEKQTVQLPGRTMKVASVPALGEQTKREENGNRNESEITVPTRKKRKYIVAVLLVLLLAAGGGFGGWMFYQKTSSPAAQMMEQVSACMQEEDYTGALELLHDQSVVVKGSQELTDLQEQCETAYRDSIIQAAEAAQQKGELADAVKTIQQGLNVLKRDEQLLDYQEQYKTAYREQIIAQAKTAYEEQDNTAAQTVIEQGLEVLLRDKTLLEYQKLCEQITPVPLQEMQFVDGNLGQNSVYSDTGISDGEGNQYTGYFTLTAANAMLGLTSRPGYNTFELDGAYQTFTATYFVQSGTDAEHSARFLVLADDVIIYDSGEKTAADGAEQISLDISGVSRLTIQAEENHISLFSHGPSVIVTNAMLKQPFELKTE